MDSALGILYIIAIAIFLPFVGSKLNWPKTLPTGGYFIYILITAFSLFFLNFYLIGSLELLIENPKVNIFNAWFLLIVLEILSVFIFFRVTGQYSFSFPNLDLPPRLRPQAKITKYCTLGAYLVLAGLLALGFPRGFEVSAYHLPIAINIFQQGSLQVWDQAFMHTYPANMSIWDGFWLQILPERWISVINLPFLALSGFFLFQLCKLIGADRSASWLIACGLTTIPLYSFSALELGADVAGVAFLLAAIYLALASPNAAPGGYLLSGLAAGIAYGFKATHLVPAALLFVLILFNIGNAATSSHLEKVARATKFAFGFLLTAGVWLLRNYLELGNPTYPVHFGSLWNALGFKAAPDFIISDRTYTQSEWVHASWEWLIYPWVEWHFIGQNFKHSSGLGAFFAATVPVTWLSYTITLISNSWEIGKRNFTSPVFVLYSLGTLLFVVWWFIGDRQPRYVMSGIALLLPLSALYITEAGAKLRNVYEWVLVAGILFMLFVPVAQLAPAQGSLISFNGLPSRSKVMEYPEMIDRLENGATILDIEERVWHYPLFGEKLKNRVISHPEALRLFRQGDAWNLDAGLIRKLGVTYLYAHGSPQFIAGCINIQPAGELDRNPFNGVKLDKARVLYRVMDNCPGHP